MTFYSIIRRASCWLAFAASTTGTAAVAQETATIRVAFSITPSTPMLPYLVAEDTGWYKKNGLDVQEMTVLGDASALRAVISGSADVAQLGLPTVLQAVSETGANLKLIGSWQPVVDYQFIGARKSVNSLEDFSGKVFATASPGDLTYEIPQMVFKKRGISTSGMTFIAVGSHPDRLKSIEAGKAQVSMVNLITAEYGVEGGAIRIVGSVKDEFPDLGFSYLVTTGADTRDPAKRKMLATLVKGGIYGARYIMANPDSAAQILHQRVPDLPLDLIRKVLAQSNSLKVWGYDGGLDTNRVQFTSDLSVQYRQMPNPVKADSVIDAEFVEKAVAELGSTH